MKISIIVVCYNEENGIADTIESIVNQSYKNYQLIVIDGKSTDNTMNIIKSYNTYISKLLSEKDKGVYFAMNKGLNFVDGDIIGFLNGGDRLSNINVFSDIVEKFKFSNIDFVYGNKAYFRKLKKTKIVRKWIVGEIQRKKFTRVDVTTPLNLYKKRCFF